MRARPTVLVVDDEQDFRDTFARLLRRQGYDATTVGSYVAGRDALDMLPDLLIADMRLPDGDGLNLVRAAAAAVPPIPTIVVSGYLTQATYRVARAAGAGVVLPKPFTVNAFASAIEQARQLT
jgi:CheY-like chemotaxis protein